MRVFALNNYLERFPTAFNAVQKINDDEVVDIIEFGTTNKWQSEMVHLGYDSVVANSQELVEFCEHLEFDEDLNQKPEVMPKPSPSGGKMGRSYVNKTSHESEESRDVRAALASWRVLGSGCSASTLCASSTLFYLVELLQAVYMFRLLESYFIP